MAIPTIQSTGTDLERDFKVVVQSITTARQLAVTWKANLEAGPSAIDDIINGLYIPFAQKAPYGIWRTLALFSNKNLRSFYADQVSKRIEITDVYVAQDGITVEGHAFEVDDLVHINGPGTPPGGLSKNTDYYIHTVQGENVALKNNLGGTVIDLSAGADGLIYLELQMYDELVALRAAIETVIDDIITRVPVVPTTEEIRGLKFDKDLVSSDTGLSKATATVAQTAGLAALLQDIIDLIEGPI